MPGAPRGRGGVPPTQCGSHSSALAEKSTLPTNGYAHATWMPYAQSWGEDEAGDYPKKPDAAVFSLFFSKLQPLRILFALEPVGGSRIS